ncbi:MAG: hypothetical protein OHK0052_24640 [Anaerolineales bacterium]
MSNQASEATNCLDLLKSAAAQKQGILQVSMDTAAKQVALAYDAERISEEEITHLIRSVSPQIQKRWQTCTLRLEASGGRSCESCAARLEQRINEIPGVQRATASYTGGAVKVVFDGQVQPETITTQILQLSPQLAPSAAQIPPPTAARPPLVTAQTLEAVFTAITLIGMLVGWLLESIGAPAWSSITAFVIAYLTGGAFGLKGGIESLMQRTIDIDLLMILAALGAAVVGQPFEGAMLLFLFSLSNVLQDYAIGKTRSAIQALMKLRPSQATVRRAGAWVLLPIEQILVGDEMLVRPGERIALDGILVSGEGAVDQSSITGESIPVTKMPGDKILSGSINREGSLQIRVSRLAKDSTIAKLIQLVEEAQSEKAQTQRWIDRAEQIYAALVIAFTALAIVIPIWLLAESFDTAFYRAMTLMVAASPCALVISTPATVLSAIGNGARKGILFKGGAYVEQAATIKVITFDKTGTLTQGKPQVTDVVTCAERDETELLELAAAAESRSEHPLAQAIVTYARQRSLKVAEPEEFRSQTGKGVWAVVAGRALFVGNLNALNEYHLSNRAIAETQTARLQAEGKTVVAVSLVNEAEKSATLLGLIAIADTLRANAADVVQRLQARGIKVAMLTGDNARTAAFIAKQAGVDTFYADLMPEDKVRIVKELGQYGAVAMVGDGVNDAPALASATIGIAMGAAGSDVALETADVVLMADNLENLPYLIDLSHATRRTLIANLSFALGMIVLMVLSIFAVALPLPLAVLGHEGGTVLVSLNGLRMLFYRPK